MLHTWDSNSQIRLLMEPFSKFTLHNLLCFDQEKERGFKIEEHNWCGNKLKDHSVQLHILNKNFTETTHIKKDKIIAYMFLLGEKANDKIITEYSSI